MAQTVKNKRSNRTSTTNNIVVPAQPASNALQNGEIAINYADGYETLFIKNDSDEVVSFSNDNTLLSAMAQYEGKTPYVTSTPAASVTIDSYKMYDFGTVARSMTVVFNTGAEESGYTKEYSIRFVAGNGCAITLPNSVMYANHTTPTYTAGRTYEINVVNNCAIVAEFY